MVNSALSLLAFDEYGQAIGRAATVLRANAAATAPGVAVPTCPGWTVHDLVAHQGMVHRWATDHLSGRRGVDPSGYESEGLGSGDQLGWFDTGATALLQALVDAPEDLEAPVFLHDAPPARLFWARRQCHETTIHAVDALSARLGRPPLAEETWIPARVALDGIDELLVGFVGRGRRNAVHTPEPTTVVVRPDTGGIAWHVTFSPEAPAVTRRMDPSSEELPDTEHVVTGSPVALYLALWNRADATSDTLRWWREVMHVSWR